MTDAKTEQAIQDFLAKKFGEPWLSWAQVTLLVESPEAKAYTEVMGRFSEFENARFASHNERTPGTVYQPAPLPPELDAQMKSAHTAFNSLMARTKGIPLEELEEAIKRGIPGQTWLEVVMKADQKWGNARSEGGEMEL